MYLRHHGRDGRELSKLLWTIHVFLLITIIVRRVGVNTKYYLISEVKSSSKKNTLFWWFYFRGLLGAHTMAVALSENHGRMLWYKDQLLVLAQDIADRLIPAFNTTTGIPYPKVVKMLSCISYLLNPQSTFDLF